MKNKFNSLKYILAITKCSLSMVMVIGTLKLVDFKDLSIFNQFLLGILLMIAIGFIVTHIRNDISFKTFNIRKRTEFNLIGKKMVTLKWYFKLILLFLGVKDFLYDNLIFSENVIIFNVFQGDKIYLDKVFTKKNKITFLLEGAFLVIYTVGIAVFMLFCIKHFIVALLPVGILLNGDNVPLVHKPLRKLFL